MGYLVLGVGVLAAFLMVSRWYVSVDTRTLLRALRRLGLVLAGLVVMFLAVTGRLGLAIGAGAFLLPWAMQHLRASRSTAGYAGLGSAGGGSGGARTSSIRTRFIHMKLDHASGDLDGNIVDGRHVGRRLGELGRDELVELLSSYRRMDPSSEQLLEAYLDRRHPEWRQHRDDQDAKQGNERYDSSGPDSGTMSREDAYRVLGLEPGASDVDIKAAHHRLIAGLHPDRGGSSYLSAQVNRARDILFGR